MTEPHQYLLTKVQQYCNYQERCLYEVKTKLTEWQAQEKVIEEIINHLIRNDYLNEERYAKSFATGKFRQKHWGKNKIIYELKKKRIPDLIIQIGLQDIDENEYEETLKNLLLKKSSEIKETDSQKKKYKIATYGTNKGFRSGLVWDIINKYL
jgi:regulatory protein